MEAISSTTFRSSHSRGFVSVGRQPFEPLPIVNITIQVPNEPWKLLCQPHVGLAVLGTLCPQRFLGTTISTTLGSSQSSCFVSVPNELREPICEPHVDVTILGVLCPHLAQGATISCTCRYSHSRRLGHQWALGATISTSCNFILFFFRF